MIELIMQSITQVAARDCENKTGLLVGCGKKSQISRDFQGQIRGKMADFAGKFAGIFEASFAEK